MHSKHTERLSMNANLMHCTSDAAAQEHTHLASAVSMSQRGVLLCQCLPSSMPSIQLTSQAAQVCRLRPMLRFDLGPLDQI